MASNHTDATGRPSADGAPRPNVVLVVLDTVRAQDAVPPRPKHTPTLAALADEGAVYTGAFAAAPWTLPSHGSLFTGTYPSKHGAHGDQPRLAAERRTLAEAFRAAGYETAAVTNNTWVSEQFGFDRGFDAFREMWGDGAGGAGADSTGSVDSVGSVGSVGSVDSVDSLGALGRALRSVGTALEDRVPLPSSFAESAAAAEEGAGLAEEDAGVAEGAERTARWLTDWLEDRGQEPFFCFANFIDAHLPYRPPAEYARPFLPPGWSYEEALTVRQDPRAFDVGEYDLTAAERAALRGLYRGEIARLDAALSDVREALRDGGHWEDTVLVVVGDHGENVGDHGFLGHQYNVYDTLLRVPLFVTGGAFDGLGRVDDLVQLVDLAPTLLDAAGVDDQVAREQFQARSFHPESSSPPRERVFAEYLAPQPPVATLLERYDDVPQSVFEYDRTLRTVRTREWKFIRGSDGHRELYRVATDLDERVDRAASDPATADRLAADLDAWLDSFDHAERTTGAAPDVGGATQERLERLGYL